MCPSCPLRVSSLPPSATFLPPLSQPDLFHDQGNPERAAPWATKGPELPLSIAPFILTPFPEEVNDALGVQVIVMDSSLSHRADHPVPNAPVYEPKNAYRKLAECR